MPATRLRLLPLCVFSGLFLGAAAPTLRAAELRDSMAMRKPTVVIDIDSAAAAERIDRQLAEHWKSRAVTPAPSADDAEFLRRLTLDLTGRVPTPAEQVRFRADPVARRRMAAIDRLLDSPEFPLHFGRVLDDWIQRNQQGDEAFVDWLRLSLRQERSWQTIFRTVMVGPWTDEAERSANRFLIKRAKNLDTLTADAGRAFFGVDITCARCHDHPLVDDWKQDHYYGLAAFFHRTQVSGKDKDAKLDEKKDGELTFEAQYVGQKTAVPLYLTERKVEVAAPGSRREQLVAVALEERARFSRAAANRMWAWFFSRGLVEPVDQMHSANPPSVPGLLERLADDFAAADYDLKFLVRAIVLTRAYGLSSRTATPAEPGDFAAATLRPLTPRQFALSLTTATGDEEFAAADDDAARTAAYRAAEKRAVELLPSLDATFDGYRAGVGESLYLSNHPAIQKLFVPEGENLAARLVRLSDPDARLVAAFRALAAREPSVDERTMLRDAPTADLLWILATSVEFRFNH